MTQKEALKRYFKRHKKLTQLEAYNKVGSTRLSERVRELESSGWLFMRKWKKACNRFGESVRCVEYVLLKSA